jgi:hypothetical protein
MGASDFPPTGDSTNRGLSALPVPARRDPRHFNSESLGSEIVLFDTERIQYHTLNETANAVWKVCDGLRTPADIARDLELPGEAVELAVAELGEAGLLEASQEAFDARVHRRRALKLVAAGVIGAVGLPAVTSITVPHAMASVSSCGEPSTVPLESPCGCTSECVFTFGEKCCCSYSQGQVCTSPSNCSTRGGTCVPG